jgi:uncharacterized protein (TIGR02996 family)
MLEARMSQMPGPNPLPLTSSASGLLPEYPASGAIIPNAYFQELTTDARITRLEKLALAHGQEADFIRSLIKEPSDDTLRRVFWDYLQEQGRDEEAREMLLERKW